MEKFSWSKIILFTIIIGLIGSLLHFVYGWSGEIPGVGLFSAVNESTWEHTKLAFIPLLIFWIALSWYNHKKSFSWTKAAVSGIWSILIAIIAIPMFFYFCTQGLGLHSLALDIIIFFLAVFLALVIGAHIYNRKDPTKVAGIVALVGFALLFIVYVVWTFMPPNLPLFISPV